MELLPKNEKGSLSPRLLLGIAVAALLPLALLAAPPQWWSDRGVTNPSAQASDYAAVNQGQVKTFVKAAVAEMDAHLPGGAGDALHALVAGWATPTAQTSDYSAVNLGQLKALAKPIYDRLIAAGYAGAYPWAGSANAPSDYAMANIGQVKNLLSFDLVSMGVDNTRDTDGNGLPDWWENQYFGHIGVDPGALVAWSGGTLTNLQAYQQGLDPVDYYNGRQPRLSIVSGNNQTGAPGGFVPQALVVSLSGSNGLPLAGAPVQFAVTSGSGTLQKSKMGTPGQMIAMLTDASGQAKVYFQLPNEASATSEITATPGSGSYSSEADFSENSDGGGGGTYPSPFDISNLVGVINADGSEDMTWQNNTDDPAPIPVWHKDKGSDTWRQIDSVPAGTISYHVPPNP